MKASNKVWVLEDIKNTLIGACCVVCLLLNISDKNYWN